MSDNFYRAFEDRHRGSRDMITARLEVYLPFVAPLAKLLKPARAIDLGCGRGEWIELIGRHGMDAAGVDLDDGMLQACRERGLNAQLGDALGCLRALPDNSQALVSAFHVVEHIPFDMVREVIVEALRVLQPGGLLILETPNAENIMVGTSGFFMDPSHEKPLPSDLLSFAVEYAGFARTKVLRLQEPESLYRMPSIGVLEVLSAVSPDYSVVAQKAADAGTLAAFDEAFATEFGISLPRLATQYDTQIREVLGEQAEKIELRLGQLEDHLAQSRKIMEQHAANAVHAAQHAAAQSEQRARELHAQVAELLNSRSWRVTAPMRGAGEVARRLRDAARSGRLLSAVKNRLPAPVRHLTDRALMRAVHEIDRRPAWRDFVLRHEARIPGVGARLKALHQPPAPPAAAAPEVAPEPKQLSASARRVLADIDRSNERR